MRINPVQLQLNFQPAAAAGKRTERLTVTASTDFKGLVDALCRVTGETISELGHRYFVNGLRDDIGNLFLAEPHLDKRLVDLFNKKI